MQVAVVGVGLIGGSIALGARQRLGATAVGFDTASDALEMALERGAIDIAADDLKSAVAGADAAFVAAPVGALPELVGATLSAAREDCVVTDVGSTKRSVVTANADPRFVGGHPLAGAETTGVRYARADLFDGATWYLTPSGTTSGVLYERLYRMLHGLGALPCAIDADKHDSILATVSHLPHVLANVLVTQAAMTLAEGDEQLPATGPSFRDATRVAGASSRIWTDIYLSNRDALANALEHMQNALERARQALRSADAQWLERWNDEASAARRKLLEDELAGAELFELRASVPNRPGVVAQLALELGRAGVNISDMALYPAADMSEGVIALWVAGEEAAQRAEEMVASLGFPVARA
ncbi:MAG: prephenate dehydrogenase/arogenate dehydrogenase family protein [Solirubrobacterales bacterium]|nr:prephenate dehydrogenase/arogenate dehydrogenase family protein [Solirubrobacterales bacterium]